ncbi:hypothetical protein DCAR_0415504 [Daucus carota subsp. sativus]|uniref:Uncharacterized protein n=2 Tax=Daucus carota subsp. sativus TaxID=79200 RepID=A0AAF0WWW2_DAUCS|nr:PREDICTED: uncharacterized protein LOC108216109 [Daucus carota subsp. sativus]WOG96173.1 hypothetical protein DCAR_0415504 [Daucus carota subsp. sativus]
MTMEEKSITMHQTHSDEDDEETVSLCDLPIYSESPKAKNDNDQMSSSVEQPDQFEFFSEEWSGLVPSPIDNFLFCGKLIVNKGYKQSVVSETPHKLRESTKERAQENQRGLQWNLNARTSKSRDQKGKCKKKNDSGYAQAPSSSSASMSNGIITRKNDNLANRITILKSPTRSRWFVFLFRSKRDLTDMETRETMQRHNNKIMLQQSQVVSGKIANSKSRGIRWWKLIRLLGCDNLHRADAVIKSSYSRAPLIRE